MKTQIKSLIIFSCVLACKDTEVENLNLFQNLSNMAPPPYFSEDGNSFLTGGDGKFVCLVEDYPGYLAQKKREELEKQLTYLKEQLDDYTNSTDHNKRKNANKIKSEIMELEAELKKQNFKN